MHAGIQCKSEGGDLRGSRNNWLIVIGVKVESMVTDGERMLLQVGGIYTGFGLLPISG